MTKCLPSAHCIQYHSKHHLHTDCEVVPRSSKFLRLKFAWWVGHGHRHTTGFLRLLGFLGDPLSALTIACQHPPQLSLLVQTPTVGLYDFPCTPPWNSVESGTNPGKSSFNFSLRRFQIWNWLDAMLTIWNHTFSWGLWIWLCTCRIAGLACSSIKKITANL